MGKKARLYSVRLWDARKSRYRQRLLLRCLTNKYRVSVIKNYNRLFGKWDSKFIEEIDK